MLESMEGRRATPRLKPPFPAEVGYLGCPTLIANVETLSHVPAISAAAGLVGRAWTGRRARDTALVDHGRGRPPGLLRGAERDPCCAS